MRDDGAVSPVIGTLLILAIFTVVAATVLLVGRPEIVEYQEKGTFDTVVAQLNAVNVDIRQLAVSGNAGEIRQPALALGGGAVQIRDGHLVAVSAGLFHENFSAVNGMTTSWWLHQNFSVGEGNPARVGCAFTTNGEWDAADPGIQIHNHAGGGVPSGYLIEVYRFDGDAWVSTFSITRSIGAGSSDGIRFHSDCAKSVLGNGPWRIDLRDDAAAGDPLVGQIFIMQETQMVYTFSGESGIRRAFVENGGVFTERDGRYTLSAPSLVNAPNETFGNRAFTMRVVNLSVTGGAAAAGNTRIALQLNLNTTEFFQFDAGAAVATVQYSGPFEEPWKRHLEGRGFTESVAADGMYYARGTTVHEAYPFHLGYSKIDTRMRQV